MVMPGSLTFGVQVQACIAQAVRFGEAIQFLCFSFLVKCKQQEYQ